MSMKFVAEVGSNWLGDVEMGLKHIDEAANVGATGVKFQLFRGKSLYADGKLTPTAAELQPWHIETFSQRAHERGLAFSCTPFAPSLIEMLSGYVDEVKISAYDLTYDDLVREAGRLRVPVVLSTAMSTCGEIEHAISLLPDDTPITLLHGTAAYPAPPSSMALEEIKHLARGFLKYDVLVGLSDHTIGIVAAIAATTLGATHIEKHFNVAPYDPEDKYPSPDAPTSANKDTMRLLVTACLEVREMLGIRFPRGPIPIEEILYKYVRRTNEEPLRRVIPAEELAEAQKRN